VQATYEVLRRQRINKVARTIIGIARREEWRKVKAALYGFADFHVRTSAGVW
jgi:hypothetical protein